MPVKKLMIFPVFSLIAAWMCIVSAMVGCGGGGADGGPERFPVSGKATFNGQPIPAGIVYLEADTSKGATGMVGTAAIHSGAYDTGKQQGVVGGPTVIRVEGFDGKATPDKPYGDRLFVPHSIEVDLPKSATTQDIDVPASAADKLSKVADPA